MNTRVEIPYISDPEAVDAFLKEGPQLCMVLNSNLNAIQLWNMVDRMYVFVVDIDGEERYAALCGAHKQKGPFRRDTEQIENTFGRQVDEQIHDPVIEIDGVPYIPFCEGLDPRIIDKMREAVDVREIEHQSTPRLAVLGYYYDEATAVAKESKIIAQGPMILNTPNPLN